MISRLEWHGADAKRYDGSRMPMDNAFDAGESFEERLVNKPLGCAHRIQATFGSGGCIFQVEFVEVFRRADERWRHAVAGHEKGGIVQGVANADMTLAGYDGIIVKDMVGCN